MPHAGRVGVVASTTARDRSGSCPYEPRAGTPAQRPERPHAAFDAAGPRARGHVVRAPRPGDGGPRHPDACGVRTAPRPACPTVGSCSCTLARLIWTERGHRRPGPGPSTTPAGEWTGGKEAPRRRTPLPTPNGPPPPARRATLSSGRVHRVDRAAGSGVPSKDGVAVPPRTSPGRVAGVARTMPDGVSRQHGGPWTRRSGSEPWPGSRAGR